MVTFVAFIKNSFSDLVKEAIRERIEAERVPSRIKNNVNNEQKLKLFSQ
jgi:hypothetical protein